jgi:hypothetical protein
VPAAVNVCTSSEIGNIDPILSRMKLSNSRMSSINAGLRGHGCRCPSISADYYYGDCSWSFPDPSISTKESSVAELQMTKKLLALRNWADVFGCNLW